MEHQIDFQDGTNAGNGSNKPLQKFMFIDPTSHGANAKPNKAVRSFVMHHARRAKPWSTRQKKHDRVLKPKSKAKTAESSITNPQESREATVVSATPNPTAQERTSTRRGRDTQTGLTPASARKGSPRRWGTLPSGEGNASVIPRNQDVRAAAPRALARHDGFALGVTDPFDCLPVKLDKKKSAMLHYFVSAICPLLIPVDIYHSSTNLLKTHWVASSLQNITSPPFAYALLTSSALLLMLQGLCRLDEVLYFKSKAISEINKLLSDPNTSVADGNIAAVFTLLTLEEYQLVPGNQSRDEADWSELQRKIHLNGLCTMISQRGGLSALSTNRCLQTFIMMHSTAHATTTFKSPYTTLLDSTGRHPRYPTAPSPPPNLREGVIHLFRNLKLPQSLLDILTDLALFTHDTSSWYAYRHSPVDPLELQKHGCVLNARLLSWYSGHSRNRDNQEEGTQGFMQDAIALASLVYVIRITQPFGPGFRGQLFMTVKKLRTALGRAPASRWVDSEDALLWTVTMGALASLGTNEFSYFKKYGREAFAGWRGKEKGVEDLLGRMRSGLWLSVLMDEEVKPVWVEMRIVTDETVTALEEDANEGEGVTAETETDVKGEDAVGRLTGARFFSPEAEVRGNDE
ncbi:uncharacterized protein EI97DRAFT_391056 [Westerdykella ornata]|uniref:Uncharacterized protein n=1 Tax=Westerdykella ornata TaxID=318751 RepID=A0A6A6JVA8_WESOR|nr:uncharacterized protein EI97DRAFT_391056 [Westerdykella ornata]KAF2280175.1 hypothetical protein EI97DRAFT_391056 [Westerdykella ornata]